VLNLTVQFFLLFWNVLVLRTNILHIGSLYPELFLGSMIASITRTKLVVSIYGEELTTLHTAKALFRWLVLKSLRRCDLVLTISEFARRRIENQGIDPKRIVRIYPGVDLHGYNNARVTKPNGWQGFSGKRILLTVGRLVPRKGQDMVLQALPGLITEFPQLCYVIVGNGPCEQNLADTVKSLQLEQYVRIVTDAKESEVIWYYQNCEIFITANRELLNGDTEGFGIVFLEAGYWGKPVIGGKEGGVPEAIEHGVTGLLVDGADQHQIASAAAKLLRDKPFAELLGKNGRARAHTSDWQSRSAAFKADLEALVGCI
jgi:phosphatidylinositol alpha-1,6-mannosyltransferase